jgi:putative hemolysin
MQLDGTVTDRKWRDAFIRIARHHDALLVPVWFSGRNRLRYYLAARVCRELGFLALPSEFLNLRGQSMTARIGKPIDPDSLGAIGDRRAQLSFLRSSVYELGDEGAPVAAAKAPNKAGMQFVPQLSGIDREIELPLAA